MKTMTLKETANHCVVEIDQANVLQEPTLLETDGMPIVVLIPPAEFDREVAAFEQLKPALLKQYAGRAVAIHRGQVVVVGDDKMAVLDQVLAQFGPIPCYIEWVEPVTPRRARISTAWVAR